MPLFASDKKQIAAKGCLQCELAEMDAEISLRDNPTISRTAIEKFLRGCISTQMPPVCKSRGYVREGEEVSAEEMDRRTMKILEQW